MDISEITSGLAQETGYSVSQVTSMLGDRLDHYQKLAKKTEETLAASELGKEIKTENKIILPAIGCSLGNTDVAKPLRELATSDPDGYTSMLGKLLSGNEENFISALKGLTRETETTLRTAFSKLDQGGAARFVDNLNQLTNVSAVNDEMTEEEAETALASSLANLTNNVAALSDVDKTALARTIRGIQIYV